MAQRLPGRFAAMAARTLACLLPFATGCASLADRITEPDPGIRSPSTKLLEMETGSGISRRSALVATGIQLAWLDIPAADRGFYASMTPTAGGGLKFELGTRRGRNDVTPVPARGTVVYLHGWTGSATTMLPWALALSEHGYRGIAVDLRGHGASDDAPPGFGPREARDVAALVDLLVEADGLGQPLYLVGMSYGATTALFAEPLLRDRVAGIVAIEPFATAESGIVGAVKGWMASSRGGFRERLGRAVMRLQTSPADIDRAIDEAGDRLGLDLRAIDAAVPVAASRTCMALIHGSEDRWLPAASTRALAEKSERASYLEVDGSDHLTLPWRVDLLGEPIANWMEDVASGGCPAIVAAK